MLAASIVFAAIFAISAIAQTGAAAQPAGPGRIGLVNTYAFGDDKAGIAKFKTALNSLESEFKPINDDLKAMGTKYQSLAADIQKAQQGSNPAVPTANADPKVIQAKVDEYQALETNIKRKQEDAKARYERRYSEVVGPVFNDIIKAMNEFAKQKGYAVILDGAKLEEASILLGFDDKYDVTKDFIAFYNARPAGTAATTATPK
jgi:Skp family chaperone for outer membrane proteins